MDLLDELVAVNVTLEKWEEIQRETVSLNNLISDACGFCNLYLCGEDTCPAYERCFQISVIHDAHYRIMSETKEHISWLKKRETMLTKKIEGEADAD